MFTGLVETIGAVRRRSPVGGGIRLSIDVAWPDGEPPRSGDSVAVNGACLTAVDDNPTVFSADVSRESLDHTVLGDVPIGARVNLERALRVGDRLGGHIVQGHIDTIVRLLAVHPESGFARWTLSLPSEVAPEVARKGSVAIDGVSLTVASVASDSFDVALIPETLKATTLQDHRPGDRLHLETDVLAKYVGRRVGGGAKSLIDDIFGGG